MKKLVIILLCSSFIPLFSANTIPATVLAPERVSFVLDKRDFPNYHGPKRTVVFNFPDVMPADTVAIVGIDQNTAQDPIFGVLGDWFVEIKKTHSFLKRDDQGNVTSKTDISKNTLILFDKDWNLKELF